MNPRACNIGSSGVEKRKRIGMILLIIAGFVSGYLISTHAPWSMRIIVFPLFVGGFVSLLESARKVCVYHSWKKTVESK